MHDVSSVQLDSILILCHVCSFFAVIELLLTQPDALPTNELHVDNTVPSAGELSQSLDQVCTYGNTCMYRNSIAQWNTQLCR